MSRQRRNPLVHLGGDTISQRLVYGALLFVLIVSGVLIFVAWMLFASSLRALDHPLPWGAPAPVQAPQTISEVRQTLIRRTSEGIERIRLQNETLSSWGWIDREKGIARMPIDEAMRQLAAGEGAQ